MTLTLFVLLCILIFIFILKYRATIRYGYKVVTIREGNFYFAVAFNKAQVQYYLNKIARAPKYLADHGHHLLIFDTIDSACWFSIQNGKSAILKVRYNSYNIVELPNMCSLYDLSELIINPLPQPIH